MSVTDELKSKHTERSGTAGTHSPFPGSSAARQRRPNPHSATRPPTSPHAEPSPWTRKRSQTLGPGLQTNSTGQSWHSSPPGTHGWPSARRSAHAPSRHARCGRHGRSGPESDDLTVARSSPQHRAWCDERLYTSPVIGARVVHLDVADLLQRGRTVRPANAVDPPIVAFDQSMTLPRLVETARARAGAGETAHAGGADAPTLPAVSDVGRRVDALAAAARPSAGARLVLRGSRVAARPREAGHREHPPLRHLRNSPEPPHPSAPATAPRLGAQAR